MLPLLLPLPWIEAHRWIDGSGLGVLGGTLVGWLVLSGLSFTYHRASHGVPALHPGARRTADRKGPAGLPRPTQWGSRSGSLVGLPCRMIRVRRWSVPSP